jgi:FtsH-binding integral membrane protein
VAYSLANDTQQLVLLFIATFGNVFLLGLSSQFVRDQKIAQAFTISWGITWCQFLFARISANTTDADMALFVSGWGGSLGIVASILFYRWYQVRIKRHG